MIFIISALFVKGVIYKGHTMLLGCKCAYSYKMYFPSFSTAMILHHLHRFVLYLKVHKRSKVQNGSKMKNVPGKQSEYSSS